MHVHYLYRIKSLLPTDKKKTATKRAHDNSGLIPVQFYQAYIILVFSFTKMYMQMQISTHIRMYICMLLYTYVHKNQYK